jgi:hypothetical protein
MAQLKANCGRERVDRIKQPTHDPTPFSEAKYNPRGNQLQTHPTTRINNTQQKLHQARQQDRIVEPETEGFRPHGARFSTNTYVIVDVTIAFGNYKSIVGAMRKAPHRAGTQE